jgi:hypothetical protein
MKASTPWRLARRGGEGRTALDSVAGDGKARRRRQAAEPRLETPIRADQAAAPIGDRDRVAAFLDRAVYERPIERGGCRLARGGAQAERGQGEAGGGGEQGEEQQRESPAIERRPDEHGRQQPGAGDPGRGQPVGPISEAHPG